MPARLLLLGLAAALVAGCDDGTRLSRSQFVARANAICDKYEKKVTEAMRGVSAGNRQLADAIDKALPVIREGNDELRGLKPPKEVQRRYDRWMTIADAEVVSAERLRDAIRKKDVKGERAALRELQRQDADQDTVARGELGLAGCASG